MPLSALCAPFKKPELTQGRKQMNLSHGQDARSEELGKIASDYVMIMESSDDIPFRKVGRQ